MPRFSSLDAAMGFAEGTTAREQTALFFDARLVEGLAGMHSARFPSPRFFKMMRWMEPRDFGPNVF